jgi:hypothetical protein
VLAVVIALLATTPPSVSAAGPEDRLERKANRAHRIIKRRHLPYGTIFSPRFESPDSRRVVGYTHSGDSAIWTGHYLAAEALRYEVTGARRAKRQIRRTLDALQRLVDVTGSDVLARATAPIGSPWEQALRESNPDHLFEATLDGVPHVWHGNTSRDQYSGVFFGLSLVWEMVPQAATRQQVADLVTRLLENLLDNEWIVWMPDGTPSTTFLQRPDQQLAFLQVGRQVNPGRFAATYASYRDRLGLLVGVPIGLELTDPHGSYFKFNLDAINLLHLIRLEDSTFYANVWSGVWLDLWQTVRSHDNAHFAAIDRWLRGAEPGRDARIVQLLGEWLQRPDRDVWVDLSSRYEACGNNRACEPIPVAERPSTDFLWQRSPFLLSGGGDGDVEGSAIDLILPYWMARYLGVI